MSTPEQPPEYFDDYHDEPVGPADHLPGRIGWAIGAIVLLALSLWAFTGTTSEQTIGIPGVRVGAGDAYNPVLAGEELPEGFRQLLPRDAIAPIYDPEFATANRISWAGETDVIGVSLNGESKAYPVSFLGGRELVIDEIGDEPILVSW